MSTNNQHKPGYKHTPLGWIPEEWKIKSLSDDIENLDAGVSVNSINESPTNGEPAILKTSAVNGGFFYPEQKKRIIAEDISRAKLNPTDNSIIVSRMNTPELVGECGYVGKTFENIFLPDRLWQTRFYSNSEVNVKWLNYLLNAPRYKTKIKNIATGTSNSMKNISKEAFLNIAYISPPKNEQCKIATILSTWDEAITKTQQLIAQLQQRNKGLMQQALTGKKRLKGFEGDWKTYRIGDLTEKISRRNNKLIDARVYSVTNSRGFVLQSEHFSREVAGEDLSKHKIIKNEEFAYNPARINVGSIAYFEKEMGIISSLYVCFKTNEKLDDQYLLHLLGLDHTKYKIANYGEGGVRIYLWYELFSNIKIEIPEIDEQIAIAAMFNKAEDEVKLYEQKLAALQQQKKGLMQKLLTGEVRVKV